MRPSLSLARTPLQRPALSAPRRPAHRTPPRPPRATAPDDAAAPPPAPPAADAEDDGVLAPEDDWEVAGGPNDSLTSNTALGRAVAAACDELEVLADLERDAADRAAALLKKLGYRGSLLDRVEAAAVEEEGEGGDDA